MITNSTKVSGVSGEIDFLTLRASDNLELRTVSGDISGKEASSDGDVTLSSTSGTVRSNRFQEPRPPSRQRVPR
jgi:DUF4097 and DUF4098 domain-containing protein YvlB